MNINEKIDAIIKMLFSGNKRAFAKYIGISPTVVENIVGTRKGKPSFDVLQKICANANISAEWLLLGTDDTLKNVFNIRKDLKIPSANKILSDCGEAEDKSGIISTIFSKKDEKISNACLLPEGSHEGIPLIPFSAMAGALTGEQTALEYECERYVVPAFKGADFLMPVKGNSMTPTYVSGDIVACQRVPMADIFFQWNKPYVLDTDQGPLIKRIKPGTDTSHVLIISDNTEYDPFELPLSAIRAVALVIGIIRLE